MSREWGWTSKYNCGTFCLIWVFTEKDWYESSVLAVNEVWKLPSETVPSTSILTSLLLVGGGQRLTIVLLTWNNSSCKGCWEVSNPTFYWEHHHWGGWTMWLRAFSSLAVKTSEDADHTASLGSLLHSGLFPWGRRFPFLSSLNLSYFSLCPLSLVLLSG